jgi:hypothetical protein
MMGFIKHHAMIVTGYYGSNDFYRAYRRANEIFNQQTSGVMHSIFDGYLTFSICPDGSKEGWGDSDVGDKKRKDFKNWMFENNIYLDWVEVIYGGDDPMNKVIDSIDKESE